MSYPYSFYVYVEKLLKTLSTVAELCRKTLCSYLFLLRYPCLKWQRHKFHPLTSWSFEMPKTYSCATWHGWTKELNIPWKGYRRSRITDWLLKQRQKFKKRITWETVMQQAGNEDKGFPSLCLSFSLLFSVSSIWKMKGSLKTCCAIKVDLTLTFKEGKANLDFKV